MQNARTTDMHHSTSDCEDYKPIVSRSVTSAAAGVGVSGAAACPRMGEVAAVCLVAADVPMVAGGDRRLLWAQL
jgi:hypothetical protein